MADVTPGDQSMPADQSPPSAPHRSGFPAWLFVVVLVGAAAFVGIGTAISGAAADYECGSMRPASARSAHPEGARTSNSGTRHVAAGMRTAYAACPPTSGDHDDPRDVGSLGPTYYAPDQDVGPGTWIHNLERGYVVALYRCDPGGCPSPEALSSLRDLVRDGPSSPSAEACKYPSKILVAKFDEMSTPFAVLAWDRAMLLDAVDAAAAKRFATRWIEATAPDPNAC